MLYCWYVQYVWIYMTRVIDSSASNYQNPESKGESIIVTKIRNRERIVNIILTNKFLADSSELGQQKSYNRVIVIMLCIVLPN